MKKINFELNLLSNEDIHQLYEKHVNKPDEYYRKANDEYHKLSNLENLTKEINVLNTSY